MRSLAVLIDLYSYVIIARLLLGWFPISRGGAMETIYNAIYSVTEPVLGPLRRMIPPIGMFDISPMVVIIGLRLLSAAVAGG